jgi:hypothetical protein
MTQKYNSALNVSVKSKPKPKIIGQIKAKKRDMISLGLSLVLSFLPL